MVVMPTEAQTVEATCRGDNTALLLLQVDNDRTAAVPASVRPRSLNLTI